jgi:NCS1 family nucleobase:cation symporter-1
MLVAWAAGFVTYQLINPGYISWWVSAWDWVGHQIGFSVEGWMSASILSFVVAGLATLLVGAVAPTLRRVGPRPLVADHVGRPLDV